jgi:hypothetical protein
VVTILILMSFVKEILYYFLCCEQHLSLIQLVKALETSLATIELNFHCTVLNRVIKMNTNEFVRLHTGECQLYLTIRKK